jgi:hypothetical protein
VDFHHQVIAHAGRTAAHPPAKLVGGCVFLKNGVYAFFQ